MAATLEQAEHEVGERGGEQRAVDDVEDAAEAGDEFAGVFDFGVAFHEGFEQVAELADAADDDAEDEALPPEEAFDSRGAEGADEAGGEEAEEQALPGFAGAEPGDELVAAGGLSARIGA